MKLVDAASYFDRTEALDPSTSVVLFKGQIDPYDDSKRDANAAYRRILSVRPGTIMPALGAIKMLGETWLIGSMEPDGLQELHRQKYVLQRADRLRKVSRLGSFLAGTHTSEVWSQAVWIKDAKQLESSSEVAPLYDIYFAEGTDVRVHDVVWSAGGDSFLVLAVRPQQSGYLSANALKLEQTAPATVTCYEQTYSVSLGVLSSSSSHTASGLKVRWQSLYDYGSQADARFKAGDCAIVLPTGTSIDTACRLDLAGQEYQAVTVDAISGTVVVHARPLWA